MPRFVLLHHETPNDHARASHWDLMLEHGPVLRTWALSAWPEPGKTVAAEALADHRLDYLTYQGPISGGRGSVRRCDGGQYEIELETKRRLVAVFDGQHIAGRVTFERAADDAQSWSVSF